MNRQHKILIVDDSQFNRELLMEILGSEYRYVEAENGSTALRLLQEQPDIDLVMLDMVMPEMNGLEVLRTMAHYRWMQDFPVIVISSEQADSHMEEAYSLGVIDYIHRPYQALIVRRRVENTLALYERQRHLLSLVAQQTLETERRTSLLLEIFGSTVEYHNGESNQHILRVRTITEALLHRMVQITDQYHLTESDITRIGMASALHDIGKSRVPAEILKKPGRLTPEEFEIMKTHTTIGAAIVQESLMWETEPLLKTAYEICRWHHERWNGRGYPDGLKGEEIPISAQTVSVADAYSALTAARSYKEALSPDVAIGMIENGQCGAFSPLILRCLSDIAPLLVNEQSLLSGERDDLRSSRQRSAELLETQQLSPEPMPQRILALERQKSAFFAAQCGGIQFEYDIPTQQVRMTNWLVPPECRTLTFSLPQTPEVPYFHPEDIRRIRECTHQTTPDAPEFSMDLLLTVGVQQPFRATIRALWSSEDLSHPLFIVGQFSALGGTAESEEGAS